MEKQCGRLFRTWSPRFCKLVDHKLVYYKSDTPKAARGVVDFDLVTCAVETEQNPSPLAFRLLVLKSSKVFVFRCASSPDLLSWVAAIHSTITRSEGFRRDLTTVAIQPQFWRHDRMSQDTLLRIGNTGDLILFRSFGFTSVVQRLFTCSYIGIPVGADSACRPYWTRDEVCRRGYIHPGVIGKERNCTGVGTSVGCGVLQVGELRQVQVER